jgi:hypothetical protein
MNGVRPHQPPATRSQFESKLLLLVAQVPTHPQPPVSVPGSSHRTRCAHRLTPPILKAASAFFARELDPQLRR